MGRLETAGTAVFVQWRFLSPTLLLCAWLLVTPQLGGVWQVQLLLEAFMLLTALVTVWANPQWRRLRSVLIALWLFSVSGTILSIEMTGHASWRWFRTLELLSTVPMVAILAAGMLAFVMRQRTLALDSIFATVAAYLQGRGDHGGRAGWAVPMVPKPQTSNNKAIGLYDRKDFVYIEQDDAYECPAKERAIYRFTSIENGMAWRKYWSSACTSCAQKDKCTTSKYRKISGWEHEAVLERMQQRLDARPQAARERRETVEHTFGPLKAWMGATHFLTKTLQKVRTEMSLQVPAYNT